jgi:hypothetical protein
MRDALDVWELNLPHEMTLTDTNEGDKNSENEWETNLKTRLIRPYDSARSRFQKK